MIIFLFMAINRVAFINCRDGLRRDIIFKGGVGGGGGGLRKLKIHQFTLMLVFSVNNIRGFSD